MPSHSQVTTPQSSDSSPLNVIVVGAGLVGFAVAIALRRQGHIVAVGVLRPDRFKLIDELDIRDINLQIRARCRAGYPT